MKERSHCRDLLSRRQLMQSAAVAGAAAALGRWPAVAAAKSSAAAENDITPDEALKRLLEGNRHFVAGQYRAPGRELARVKAVAAKQHPFAAFLSCADSRVPIEIVFDQGFGDLFVVRVAGNVATSVEIASLEFGAAIAGAKLIMVLGHTNCGAVKAALAGTEVPGQISTLYQHMVPAIERGQMDLDTAVRANVRLQARKLREGSPTLAALIDAGKLKIVGGDYDLTSGTVSLVDV
jgi:carbonic anhydrase